MRNLAENLVFLRKQMDLSWRKFAKACGVSLSLIQDYSAGKREPSQRNLRTISTNLRIPISHLIGESDIKKIIRPPIDSNKKKKQVQK